MFIEKQCNLRPYAGGLVLYLKVALQPL